MLGLKCKVKNIDVVNAAYSNKLLTVPAGDNVETSPGTYPVPPEPTIKEEIVAATATPFDIVMSATASFPAAVTFVRGT